MQLILHAIHCNSYEGLKLSRLRRIVYPEAILGYKIETPGSVFRGCAYTDSKSTPCIILNIVYNLLNNIVDYIYIHFLYLINNHLAIEYIYYIKNTLNQLALR